MFTPGHFYFVPFPSQKRLSCAVCRPPVAGAKEIKKGKEIHTFKSSNFFHTSVRNQARLYRKQDNSLLLYQMFLKRLIKQKIFGVWGVLMTSVLNKLFFFIFVTFKTVADRFQSNKIRDIGCIHVFVFTFSFLVKISAMTYIWSCKQQGSCSFSTTT